MHLCYMICRWFADFLLHFFCSPHLWLFFTFGCQKLQAPPCLLPAAIFSNRQSLNLRTLASTCLWSILPGWTNPPFHSYSMISRDEEILSLLMNSRLKRIAKECKRMKEVSSENQKYLQILRKNLFSEDFPQVDELRGSWLLPENFITSTRYSFLFLLFKWSKCQDIICWKCKVLCYLMTKGLAVIENDFHFSQIYF